MVVSVTQKTGGNSLMMETYHELGEKSVRKKGTDPRLCRPVTRVLYILTGALTHMVKSNRALSGLNLGTIHAVPGARKENII